MNDQCKETIEETIERIKSDFVYQFPLEHTPIIIHQTELNDEIKLDVSVQTFMIFKRSSFSKFAPICILVTTLLFPLFTGFINSEFDLRIMIYSSISFLFIYFVIKSNVDLELNNNKILLDFKGIEMSGYKFEEWQNIIGTYLMKVGSLKYEKDFVVLILKNGIYYHCEIANGYFSGFKNISHYIEYYKTNCK